MAQKIWKNCKMMECKGCTSEASAGYNRHAKREHWMYFEEPTKSLEQYAFCNFSKEFVIAVGLTSLLILSACGGDNLGEKYVGFAKCLTEKGVVMYGAFWCPHCQNQKKMFGEKGFEQVKNVECDPRGENADPAGCEKQKIQGYPTWIFTDGTRLSGEQSLEELSVRTNCELPSASAERAEASGAL